MVEPLGHGRSAAVGVESLCNPAGVAELLHDEEALVPLDDGLELGILMARREDEPPRIAPYGRVDAERDGQAHDACVVGALAHELTGVDAEAPVDVVDLFVHGAEERLVARGTLLPEAHMTFIRNLETAAPF